MVILAGMLLPINQPAAAPSLHSTSFLSQLLVLVFNLTSLFFQFLLSLLGFVLPTMQIDSVNLEVLPLINTLFIPYLVTLQSILALILSKYRIFLQ